MLHVIITTKYKIIFNFHSYTANFILNKNSLFIAQFIQAQIILHNTDLASLRLCHSFFINK